MVMAQHKELVQPLIELIMQFYILLYGQALKHKTEFFIEYFALDLIMKNEGKGVIAWNLNDGTIHRFRSHITIISYRRIWKDLLLCNICTLALVTVMQ